MNLQERRKAAGYSQAQLAKVSGVKLGLIQKYEIGYRNINAASAETVLKLAKALNCEMVDIMEGVEEYGKVFMGSKRRKSKSRF